MPHKQPAESTGLIGVFGLISTIPKTAADSFKDKYTCWKNSRQLKKHRRSLRWNDSLAEQLREQLERRIYSLNYTREQATEDITLHPLTKQDKELLHTIREATEQANRSNVTRTAAYLECYQQHPELHWALLAHMVSRNAGWSMSDLKGGLLDNLIGSPLQEDLYRMLERCNALIFQDAYPQLQLYRHSRRLGRSCFHLLSEFHVSAFMYPFWEQFWLERNSAILAVGLIVNEQNYIEGRVVKNAYFQKNVLHRPEFRIHEWTHLNQIIFPLEPQQCSQNSSHPRPIDRMVGLSLHTFTDLQERISLGKSLYAALFGYSEVLEGVQAYALSTTFRGSRSEYWPDLFTTHKQEALNTPTVSSELQNQTQPSDQHIYSPNLHDVWQDMPYDPIPRTDWLKDNTDVSRYLYQPRRPALIEMSHSHRLAIQKLAMAHDTAKLIH